MKVVQLHRMSETEYDQKREKIKQIYGDSIIEAAARWEQELVSLFIQSDWTQQELALKEGKSQTRIGQMLCFGRFLSTVSHLNNNPVILTLTERKFRGLWEQADGSNEKTRFLTVLDFLDGTRKPQPKLKGNRTIKNEDHNPRRFSIRPKRDEEEKEEEEEQPIIKHTPVQIAPVQIERELPKTGLSPLFLSQFGDGEIHTVEELSTSLNKPQQEITKAIKRIKRDGSKRHGYEIKDEDGGLRFIPLARVSFQQQVNTDLNQAITELRAGTFVDEEIYDRRAILRAIAEKLQTIMEKWGA